MVRGLLNCGSLFLPVLLSWKAKRGVHMFGKTEQFKRRNTGCCKRQCGNTKA